MMTESELEEILTTYKWIKVKQLELPTYCTPMAHLLMVLDHHKEETEFLIAKVRELAQALADERNK